MTMKISKKGLECILSAPINERIQKSIDLLVDEYNKTGSVSEEAATLLIGPRPITYPFEERDTEAMAANYVSQREYDRTLKYVRAFIAEYAKE